MTGHQPGDPEYRAYVGPFEQYDVMGATQFALLYALGLRQHHRLLDIGCGSLRAGRLLITYLDPGNYTGIEPNTWLIDEAIANQTGRDLIDIKQPSFSDTDSFEVTELGLASFDFVVAQSIASHAGPKLIDGLLSSVGAALAPHGLAAVTFIHPDDHEPPYDVSEPGGEQPDWLYPACLSYRREVVAGFIAEAGLVGRPIAWHHPRQTWWLLAHEAAAWPPEGLLAELRGATQAEGFEASWQPPADVRSSSPSPQLYGIRERFRSRTSPSRPGAPRTG